MGGDSCARISRLRGVGCAPRLPSGPELAGAPRDARSLRSDLGARPPACHEAARKLDLRSALLREGGPPGPAAETIGGARWRDGAISACPPRTRSLPRAPPGSSAGHEEVPAAWVRPLFSAEAGGYSTRTYRRRRRARWD